MRSVLGALYRISLEQVDLDSWRLILAYKMDIVRVNPNSETMDASGLMCCRLVGCEIPPERAPAIG